MKFWPLPTFFHSLLESGNIQNIAACHFLHCCKSGIRSFRYFLKMTQSNFVLTNQFHKTVIGCQIWIFVYPPHVSSCNLITTFITDINSFFIYNSSIFRCAWFLSCLQRKSHMKSGSNFWFLISYTSPTKIWPNLLFFYLFKQFDISNMKSWL